MKNVGILTFHNAVNYGGVLQCYALQEFLKQQEIEVEVLNYQSEHIKRANRLFKFNNPKNIVKSLVTFPLNFCRKRRYFKFINYSLNLSKKLNNYNELKEYCEKNFDYIIVGSDQVWNSELTGDEKKIYFLEGINVKKVSYAASTGDNKIEDIEKIIENYKNFCAISVREESTKEILENKGYKVNLNIDPTLLFNDKMWKKCLKNERNDNKEYLLLYILNPDKMIKDVVEKIVKKIDLKTIFTFSKKKFGVKSAKSVATSGPVEFISYFKNASFVLTNSFHAVAFSIIFRKDFFVILPSKRPERITSLLNLLGLENRIVKNIDGLDNQLKNSVNYSKIDKVLNNETKLAKDYISKAIKGE